jgi:hypothetical protein
MRCTFSPGLTALLFLCRLLPAADFTERVPPPDFPLLDAAENGHQEICQLLLDSGATVDAGILTQNRLFT